MSGMPRRRLPADHAKDALYGAGGEAEQEDEVLEARTTRLRRCGTFSETRPPTH